MLRFISVATFLCLSATACQLETFDVALDGSPSPRPVPLCGDGVIEGSEICDDGNSNTEIQCEYGMALCVSCSNDCSLEFTITGPYCGDSVLDLEEFCDDGNSFTEFECDYGFPTCLGCSEDCSQEFALAGPYCGDGFLDPQEFCDDGNSFTEYECDYGIVQCYGCSEDCAVEMLLTGGYCGDGVCQPEEIPSQCSPDCNAIEDLPFCEDTLAQSFNISNTDAPGSNSNGYTAPPLSVEELLMVSVDALLYSGDAQAARESVEHGGGSHLDYTLCRDPQDPMVARWEPRLEGMGTARFALRMGTARPAIIGIPHGNYENFVMLQGVELFQNLGLRALIVNGTHRCANEDIVGCSGTTSVCGGQNSYRTSDMAHVDNTIFQWAHEILSARFPSDWVLSIHGKSGSGIHLSNGTQNDTSPDSPVAQFALALEQHEVLEEEHIRSCNDFSGAPGTTSSLCGTTNIQGRMLNYSEEPCTIAPAQASDRFIHVEQSSEVRANHRIHVENALSSVLPF